MISLLIVDDEAAIREGIKRSIKWDKHDIEVVGVAINGKEALEMSLKLKPQIVITDIRMPIMDGLEFSERLREIMPSVRIIILSGYEDFSYARKALKIGIYDYLLKPVGAEELVGVVIKIRDEIYKEIEKIERDFSKDIVLNDNLPYLQSTFMRVILQGGYLKEEQSLEKAGYLKIDVSGPEFQVIIIDIDDFFLLTEGFTENEKDLLKLSISNISLEILEKFKVNTTCYSEFDYIAIILNINISNISLVKDACKDIRSKINTELMLSTTIGIGKAIKSFEEIPKSYFEACTAIQSKFFKGKGQVIHIEEIERADNIIGKMPMFYPFEQQKELVLSLKTMDLKKLDKVLDDVFEKLDNTRENYEKIKTICIRFMIVPIVLLGEMGIDPEESIGRSIDPYTEIEKYETIEDIKRWQKDFFLQIINIIQKERSQKHNAIVMEAIKYVQMHYRDDIKVVDIASELKITPNYFSKVFKEEIGENFTEWLNKFKVHKGKEMLKDVTLKTYEIAEFLGFNDYKYFSHVFKKYTGFSPKEYREKKLK